MVKQSKRKATSPISGGKIPVPGPGRPKGSKNKFTNLRDAFMEAFEKTGGAKGLIDWVEKHPKNRAEFYKMITRMLPTNMDVTTQGNLTIVISSQYKPKKVVPTNHLNGKSNDS